MLGTAIIAGLALYAFAVFLAATGTLIVLWWLDV